MLKDKIGSLLFRMLEPYIYEKEITPGKNIIPPKMHRHYFHHHHLPQELKQSINYLSACLSNAKFELSFNNQSESLANIPLNRVLAFAVQDYIYEESNLTFDFSNGIYSFHWKSGIGSPVCFNFAPFLMRIYDFKDDILLLNDLKKSMQEIAKQKSQVFLIDERPNVGKSRIDNMEEGANNDIALFPLRQGQKPAFFTSNAKNDDLQLALNNLKSNFEPLDKSPELLEHYIDTLLVPICECFLFDLHKLFNGVATITFKRTSLMKILPTTTAELQMLMTNWNENGLLTVEQAQELLGIEPNLNNTTLKAQTPKSNVSLNINTENITISGVQNDD